MGNCASSKYTVDEDKAPKKTKLTKKQKKALEANGTAEPVAEPVVAEEAPEETKKEEEAPKADKEDIDFIDENNQQEGAKVSEETTVTESKADENQKKEVTTYQTTVVKHSQKEGDELLDHLKTEAFRTLQNLLKKQESSQKNSTVTTTASSNNEEPQKAESNENEDIVQQIKAQALESLSGTKEEEINAIIDYGAELIKGNTVKDMNELREALEKQFPEEIELVEKVINSTTGFLTAKGTEAGSLLSNILANVTTGLQGVMNETEKTTVKVTRTVTEQVMSGGQLKEVTRVITSDQPMPGAPSSNIEDVLKNLQNGLSVDGTSFTSSTTMAGPPEITRTKVVNSGTTESSTVHSEKHENVQESSLKETSTEDSVTRSQAEKVVSSAVNAAVEKVNEESSESGTLTNGVHRVEESDMHEHVTEENIKIEEESSVKTSTTRIVLNGEESVSSQIEKAQNEFYMHGKQSAEQSINKLSVNGEESVNKSSSEAKFEEKEQKSENSVEKTESKTDKDGNTTSETTKNTETTTSVEASA